MGVGTKKPRGKRVEGKRKEYFILLGGGVNDIEKCLDNIKILVDEGFTVEDKKWKVYEERFYNFLSEIAKKKGKSVVPYMDRYRILESACIRHADSEREKPDFPGEYKITKSKRKHYNNRPRWRK